jgi:hypothetical protein
MLGCLRPYAPEIAGAASNWASYATSHDDVGGYIRLRTLYSPSSLTDTPNLKSDTYAKLTGQTYAMPRPPGMSAGEAWLMPECGVGPDALDPSKDPEDKR